MTEEELRQQIQDQEHLKLLSLGYQISAVLTALYAPLGFIYLLFGGMFALLGSGSDKSHDMPPAFLGWIFVALGMVFILACLTIAALKWHVSNCLKERRSRVFCQVIAGLSCLVIPYGTLLGVLTFMVLGRPSVERMFQTAPPSP